LDNVISHLALEIEEQRSNYIKNTATEHKETFGQYLTPYSVAKYMAAWFPDPDGKVFLLDPGAGAGSLSCAFVQNMVDRGLKKDFQLDCVESDNRIIPELRSNLKRLSEISRISLRVFNEDFVKYAVDNILSFEKPIYTHAIINPPYQKIHSKSEHRKLMKMVDIDVVNMYAAFVALSLELLKDQGYLVAIIPRSFCNGTYYRPFRRHILANAVIKHIHLFNSRKSVFKDESVLQENIIIMLQKTDIRAEVEITYSDDVDLSQVNSIKYQYSSIVNENTKELIINIPLTADHKENSFSTPYSKLGVIVSTGPVVDFRSRDFISQEYTKEYAPLIYPQHISDFTAFWPNNDPAKPDSIRICPNTMKMLYKKGFYIVVRRFSSKEEKRRIVAAIIKPADFTGDYLAFENHLNVFHSGGSGLEESIAYGLLCYLNTLEFDRQFRVFSGHTQVNAGDLKRMIYPSRYELAMLGEMVKTNALTYENFEIYSERLENGKTGTNQKEA